MQIRCLEIEKKKMKSFSFGYADFGLLKKHGKLINTNCILSENTNNTLMATDIVQVAATKNSFGKKNSTVQHQELCSCTLPMCYSANQKEYSISCYCCGSNSNKNQRTGLPRVLQWKTQIFVFSKRGSSFTKETRRQEANVTDGCTHPFSILLHRCAF